MNFEFSYEEMYLFSKSEIELNKEILYHHLFDDKDDVIESDYETFFAGCDNKPELRNNI